MFPKALLFHLAGESVSTGDRLDTNIEPFTADAACTIMLDFTTTANPSSGNASTWRALVSYNTSHSIYNLMVGKRSSGQSFWFTDGTTTYADIPSATPTAGRHRYLFTHEAGSTTATLYYKRDNGTLQTVTRTKTTFTASTGKLFIGGTPSTAYALPAGTINLAQVWGRILTADEIDQFFA